MRPQRDNKRAWTKNIASLIDKVLITPRINRVVSDRCSDTYSVYIFRRLCARPRLIIIFPDKVFRAAALSGQVFLLVSADDNRPPQIGDNSRTPTDNYYVYRKNTKPDGQDGNKKRKGFFFLALVEAICNFPNHVDGKWLEPDWPLSQFDWARMQSNRSLCSENFKSAQP